MQGFETVRVILECCMNAQERKEVFDYCAKRNALKQYAFGKLGESHIYISRKNLLDMAQVEFGYRGQPKRVAECSVSWFTAPPRIRNPYEVKKQNRLVPDSCKMVSDRFKNYENNQAVLHALGL